jgi:hypothetical protein
VSRWRTGLCDEGLQGGGPFFHPLNMGTGSNGAILLGNPCSESEDFEMGAAFDGTLVLSE